MMDGTIIIDNCISNIDDIRDKALLLNYTQSVPNSKGWRGWRCLEDNSLSDELISIIADKLIENNSIFQNAEYRYHFHYSLSNNNDDTDRIHKDSKSDYAGVLYMTPNPKENSGTSFYDDNGNVINYFDNIYNRLIIYPATIWHSVNSSFGDSIYDGRLTFTIFCSLKQKSINSII